MSLVCADFFIESSGFRPSFQAQLGQYCAVVGEPAVLLGENSVKSDFFPPFVLTFCYQ